MNRNQFCPESLCCKVVMGIKTTSSWSRPHSSRALILSWSALRTTLKGTGLMRIVWPIGSTRPEQILAHALTDHRHVGGGFHVLFGEHRSGDTGQLRISKYAGSVPWIWVNQLLFSNTTCWLLCCHPPRLSPWGLPEGWLLYPSPPTSWWSRTPCALRPGLPSRRRRTEHLTPWPRSAPEPPAVRLGPVRPWRSPPLRR